MPRQLASPTRHNGTDASLQPDIAKQSSDPPYAEQPASQAQKWPTQPKAVKTSIGSITVDLIIDLLLFAASAAFLGFAIAVHHYDDAQVDRYPRTTQTLLSASKYVRRETS